MPSPYRRTYSCNGCCCIGSCYYLSFLLLRLDEFFAISTVISTKNMTSAAKSTASEAGNKTMGGANKTSEAANNTVTNATQGTSSGNQSISNSTNPLAKVPIIGKLFGGK